MAAIVALAISAFPTPWMESASAQTFTSPLPYTNSAWSQYFSTLTVNKQYYLEDFEDGLINTPGLSIPDAILNGPGANTDSVDIDDYTLNNSGTGGVSIRPAGSTLTLQFNPAAPLGGYPTKVAFVWTDGAPNSTITVIATNAQNISVAQQYSGLGDNAFSGATAEDRFIGVQWPAGIQQLQIVSNSLMEIDHVQYIAPSLGVMYTRDRMNAGGTSDLVWHNPSTGQVSIWFMNGLTKTGGLATATAPLTWNFQGLGDLDGDGDSDILWKNSATNLFHVWLMNGQVVSTNSQVQNSTAVASNFQVLGIADFNGDRKADVLIRNNNDATMIMWLMNGNTRVAGQFIQVPGGQPWAAPGWDYMGTGDFNGDGRQDILWRNATSGSVAGWLMNGFSPIESAVVGNASPVTSEWAIGAVGDLNGDGRADIIWRNTITGVVNGWIMNNLYRTSGGGIGTIPLAWSMRCSADLNGDGKFDVIWTNAATNQVNGWIMNGLTKTGGGTVATVPLASWNLLNPD